MTLSWPWLCTSSETTKRKGRYLCDKKFKRRKSKAVVFGDEIVFRCRFCFFLETVSLERINHSISHVMLRINTSKRCILFETMHAFFLLLCWWQSVSEMSVNKICFQSMNEKRMTRRALRKRKDNLRQFDTTHHLVITSWRKQASFTKRMMIISALVFSPSLPQEARFGISILPTVQCVVPFVTCCSSWVSQEEKGYAISFS